MCNEVVNSEYDSKHFTIALGLPVSLALRNHSINLYLAEKLESFDEEEVAPIKQVLILGTFTKRNTYCYIPSFIPNMHLNESELNCDTKFLVRFGNGCFLNELHRRLVKS